VFTVLSLGKESKGGIFERKVLVRLPEECRHNARTGA